MSLSPSESEQSRATQDIAVEELTCAKCGQPHRLGELICPQCGMLLAKGGQTQQIKIPALPERRKPHHGAAFADNPRSIALEIEGHSISMPVKDIIVLGRTSEDPDDPQPDIDLSPYGAHKNGVSRRHVQIRHQGFMTYVTDLGSSNGSWLNGQRLTKNRERLLRSGDELWLGRLKIRIKY